MIRTKWIGVITVCFIMVWPALLFAGEINLPKTGQQTCYDEDGNVIECTNTGQDGDIQAGVKWPEPRFEDNGNGTITDHLTGLIWLKNANCGISTMYWYDSLTYCNTLASGSCGLSDGSVAGDWRLPNIIELESLVNAEESNPAAWLNIQGFINVQSSYYCSASTYAYDTDSAWFVHMGRGFVAYSNKSNIYYVWPVRGGQ